MLIKVNTSYSRVFDDFYSLTSLILGLDIITTGILCAKGSCQYFVPDREDINLVLDLRIFFQAGIMNPQMEDNKEHYCK